MSQLSGLSATFKTQKDYISYKPRIGIALTGIDKYYSRGHEFSMVLGNTSGESGMSAFQQDAGQNGITNNDWTKLKWRGIKEWDLNDSDMANNRFTPSIAGRYFISGHLWLATDAVYLDAGDVLGIAIYKNGSIHKTSYITYAGTGTFQNFEGPTISAIVEANGIDYFELFVYQNTGTATETIATNEVSPISVFSYFQSALLTKDSNPLPSFSAVMAGQQTAIGDSAYTKLEFDTEVFDTEGSFNTGTYRWTPQTAGKYLITGSLLLASGEMSANDLIALLVYKNGAAYKQVDLCYVGAGQWESPEMACIVDMDGNTDYVELFMYNGTGGNVNTIADGEAVGGDQVVHTYFQGCCLTENLLPAMSVYQQNAGQVGIGSDVYVKLIWNNEEFDIDSDFASSKWIPSTPGKYIITGKVMLGSTGANPATGEIFTVAVYKNGSIYKQGDMRFNGAIIYQGAHVSCVVDANGTTDYFELYIVQGTGGNQSTILSGDVADAVSIYCWFQGCGIDASQDTSTSSAAFVDQLGSKPVISSKSKMSGGLTAVNNMQLDILNQELMSDLFNEDDGDGEYPNPENTDVKAYLVFDSGSTLFADSIQFFRGMIDDFPAIDYESVKLSCASIDKIVFKDKIGELVTEDAAYSGFNLPEASLGRIEPIIYGDHRFGANFTKDNSQLAADYPFQRQNNVVKAVPLGGGEFLLAGHKLGITNAADAIWLFDDTLGRLVEVAGYSVTQNTNAGCIINVIGTIVVASGTDGVATLALVDFDSAGADFVNDGVEVGYTLIIETGGNLNTYVITSVTATALEVSPPFSATEANINYRIEKYPSFHDWRSPTGANTPSSWANIDRLHDLSIALASTITTPGGAGGTGERQVNITFDVFPYLPADISAVKLYIKGKMSYTTDHVLYVNGSGAYPFTDETNDDEFHTHTGNVLPHYINSVILGFDKTAGTTASTMSVYEAIQKITYRKNIENNNMQIYFGGTGMPYSSWISNRGSHDDSGATVGITTIENGAGIVESLMRDVLNFRDINESSFDTSSVLLTTTKLSFDISERIEPDKIIHEILERLKSLGSFNYDDQFSMTTYNSSDNFTEAGSATPNDDDKFLLNPNETGSLDANTREYLENPIVQGSFWVKKAPAANIITDFIVEYFKTYDGKFAEALTDTDNTYHSEEITKTFSHPYTKDLTTAQFWLTFLIDRLNRKHWLCGFNTFYNAIAKELWDVVNVQHPILENLVSSYTTKKWRILRISVDTEIAEIDIELEEQ